MRWDLSRTWALALLFFRGLPSWQFVCDRTVPKCIHDHCEAEAAWMSYHQVSPVALGEQHQTLCNVKDPVDSESQKLWTVHIPCHTHVHINRQKAAFPFGAGWWEQWGKKRKYCEPWLFQRSRDILLLQPMHLVGCANETVAQRLLILFLI